MQSKYSKLEADAATSSTASIRADETLYKISMSRIQACVKFFKIHHEVKACQQLEQDWAFIPKGSSYVHKKSWRDRLFNQPAIAIINNDEHDDSIKFYKSTISLVEHLKITGLPADGYLFFSLEQYQKVEPFIRKVEGENKIHQPSESQLVYAP